MLELGIIENMLNILLNENGNINLKDAIAHSTPLIHLGAFLKKNRSKMIAIIT